MVSRSFCQHDDDDVSALESQFSLNFNTKRGEIGGESQNQNAFSEQMGYLLWERNLGTVW